ncbi:MAG: DeoR/GlpR family DNA-binding transcription regulator [Alphaproteobacteria bacterium]|jgi:DeoR family glycerol-3-phosphate regulon repressor
MDSPPRTNTASVETRQRAILQLISQNGYAGIDQMVEAFEVTPQTIRRDLQDLGERGLLRRHHGGASAISTTMNADYGMRHVENAAEKARIARAAAGMIPAGSSVFLTPGTTVEALARALVDLRVQGLRIITNSTVAAQILGDGRDTVVHVTGGVWQANNMSLAGPAAVDTVARYRCDFLVTSIGGIDTDGWLMEYRDEDVVVARAMLLNSRKRILLADHTKFARTASCKLAPLGQMTALVTDRPPPLVLRSLMAENGCALVEA